MKYSSQGLQVSEIIRMDLDTVDITILRWVLDFFVTGKMCHKFKDNKIYFWVNYQSIINEMPYLKIKSRRAIYDRFEKYVKDGLMERLTVKGVDEHIHKGEQKLRNGSFSYYHIDPDRMETLLGGDREEGKKPDSDPLKKGMNLNSYGSEVPPQPCENIDSKGVGSEFPTKDYSINDPSSINSSSISGTGDKKYLDKFFYGDTTYYFYPNKRVQYFCAAGKFSEDAKDLARKLPPDHPVFDKINEVYRPK